MPVNISNQKHIVERVRARYPAGPLDRHTAGRFFVELCQEIGSIAGAGQAGLHLKSDDNSATVPDGTRVNSNLVLFEDGHMFDVLAKKDELSAPAWTDKGISDKPIAQIYYRVPPADLEEEPKEEEELGEDLLDERIVTRLDTLIAEEQQTRGEIVAAIDLLRTDVVAASKELASTVTKALVGGLGGLFGRKEIPK